MIVCHLSEGQGFGEVEDALTFKFTSKAVVIAGTWPSTWQGRRL